MNTERLILDRYRLTERLAVGGTAEVWRARDERLDRDVAVKLLHPHLLPDERSRRRLASEARAAGALNHAGIVSVYDVDVDGDQPALVMELVDGEPLSARLDRGGPLAAPEAARIVAEIAEALFHAHQRGVVHRDVKPGNILLSREGRARLVDFGIAHSLARGTERLTLTGTVMGTLRYMAPEQLAGGPIGPRTDLYGLGTVLHETLTGRAPFAAATPVALAEAQRSPLSPMEDVDPALAAATRSCLSVDPVQRPLHAGALAEAMRAWLAGDPRAALALAPVTSVPMPSSDTEAVTQPMPRVSATEPEPEVIIAPEPAAPEPAPASEPAPALQHTSTSPPRWISTALALATIAAAAVISLALFAGAPAGTAGPSPSASPSPTAVPTPTPFSLAGLPPPVQEIVAEYLEKCGATEPPMDVSGMNRKQAEEALKPLIDACEEGDG